MSLLLQCLTRLYLPGYYSLWCQKIIYEDTPLERVVVSRVWLYYVIKIIDLLDTVGTYSILKSSVGKSSRQSEISGNWYDTRGELLAILGTFVA